MNERFGPNRFERLNQSSEARMAQVERTRAILDDEILVLDSSKTSLFSRIQENLTSFFRPVSRRFALPASAVLLVVAAACSGRGAEEARPRAPQNFADGLPTTLREVCKLYVSSANLGPDEGEYNRRLANTMIGVYLDSQQQNPDARAIYLTGLGFILSLETPDDFDTIKSSFRLAIERGLPDVQERLANRVIESLDKLEEGADINKETGILVDTTFDIVDDLDAYVCPE